MSKAEQWKSEPDEHDYPAAHDYLTLVMPDSQVDAIVDAMREAPIVHRKAKDLLRASGLDLLPESNVHVKQDLAKVQAGRPLSPVLLVRGDVSKDIPLIVADGYHRICASHHIDENADCPCRMVDIGQAHRRA